MTEEIVKPSEPIVPIEEQISQELVKHNVTETLINDLREKYLPLKIKTIDGKIDITDKETYLQVVDARKECKGLRVLAKKICEKGREDAVAIQKAWILKEKDVTGRIGEVEDYLEKQEDEFDALVEKDKADKKRKQEEQLIKRQTLLNKMGVLYSDGNFILNEVSFEMALIKECDEDVWQEQILPKFREEYEKVEAERIEADRKKQEHEAELKRQQEEMERKQRELAKREEAIKNAEDERLRKEEDEQRQRFEAEKAKKDAATKSRCNQLAALGLAAGFEGDHLYYLGYDCAVSHLDITGYSEEKWNEMIEKMTPHIAQKKQEAEEKRLAEIEEQKKNERIKALGESRMKSLSDIGYAAKDVIILGEYTDEEYDLLYTTAKNTYDYKQKEKWEQEQKEQKEAAELKRQQEMDQAKDKDRWEDILTQLAAITIHDMRSGQYRKKAAILREKLEEVKGL